MKMLKCIIFILMACSYCFCARYALLVGNSRGGAFQPLKYVKNDINAMQTVLSQFCGFEQRHILSCINKSATELKEIIDTLPRTLTAENDLLLFYYTGHADHESLLMGESRYPLTELKNHIKALPSNMRILIFDACQSGSFARYKGGSLQEPFLYRQDNAISGQVVLYSSSENEFSQESDFYKNSVFTFHLLNALRGCADISGDQKITLTEAYQYSYNQTVSSTVHSTGGVQHPGYQFNIQGEGTVVLADMTSRSCGVILDKNMEESIVVLDSRNEITADLSKDKGRIIFIALNPGAYELYNNKRNKSYRAKISIQDNTIITIRDDMFRVMHTVPAYSKGAQKPRVQACISLSTGFADFDLSSLSSSCNSQFTDFHTFGIHPSCTFPSSSFFFGPAIEIYLRNSFQIIAGYDFIRLSHQTQYAGTITSPGDNLTYPVSLQIEDTLTCHTVHTVIGYNFQKGILKFFSLRGGLDFVFTTMSLGSVFNNTLYSISSLHNYSDKGMLLLPVAGVAFRYNFPAPVSLGAYADYRFQTSDRPLLNREINKSAFQYNFSGVNFSVFISYCINKR